MIKSTLDPNNIVLNILQSVGQLFLLLTNIASPTNPFCKLSFHLLHFLSMQLLQFIDLLLILLQTLFLLVFIQLLRNGNLFVLVFQTPNCFFQIS